MSKRLKIAKSLFALEFFQNCHDFFRNYVVFTSFSQEKMNKDYKTCIQLEKFSNCAYFFFL